LKRVLIPDFPEPEALMPYLRRMHEARRYSNFGPLVEEFEARLAGLGHRLSESPRFAVSASSGTSALELAIAALDLPKSARALVPSLTFPATAQAAMRCGLEVVLCDVDPHNWTLTPEIASDCLAVLRPDIVLPVCTYGYPHPAEGWQGFVAETGIPVVLDGAGAVGEQRVAEGVHAAFSLHATKPLGVGEGGVVITTDRAYAARMRRMSNFGFDRGLAGAGFNAKLSELAAAVGLAQLDRWESIRERRTAMWATYRQLLSIVSNVSWQGPVQDWLATHVVVVTPQSGARLAAKLMQRDIETRRWYCPPLHRLHPAFVDCRRVGHQGADSLETADRIAEHLLGLPFHTSLTNSDMQEIVDALQDCL